MTFYTFNSITNHQRALLILLLLFLCLLFPIWYIIYLVLPCYLVCLYVSINLYVHLWMFYMSLAKSQYVLCDAAEFKLISSFQSVAATRQLHHGLPGNAKYTDKRLKVYKISMEWVKRGNVYSNSVLSSIDTIIVVAYYDIKFNCRYSITHKYCF